MPDYGIYVLDAAGLTVSGGGSLDGVTQGDGSHLTGRTITIDTPAWREIDIADPDDDNFQDNDANQTLNGAQVINGVTYVGGTRVEAEYSFTVTDGTDTWTLVGFNVNNSSPAYGTVEGVAVIGGPGGFPPAGVPLTVTGTSEGPNFAQGSYATPICFASGTRIAVPGGTCAVEDLRPGDRVKTRHHGAQRLLWCGARMFRAAGDSAPVRFAPGVLGNDAPLIVSPQHRILVTRPLAELMFCAPDVLIPALAFLDGRGVTRLRGGLVRYHHLLFAQHEIVLSDGAFSESFLPGAASLASLTPRARGELMALYPALAHDPEAYGPAAAPTLRMYEGRALLAA